MKRFKTYMFAGLCWHVAAAGLVGASDANRASNLSAGEWSYVELQRMAAPEARQGVAVDSECVYVISNHSIGKYSKSTGERLGGWECAEGDPLMHLNAGLVRRGILYGAHSNFPGVPMTSSLERWDVSTMEHLGSHSFGLTNGSLTWIEPHEEGWIACFVHYGRNGGEPGRGPEWSRLVKLDDQFRETGGWSFPAALMAKLGERGYSVSGGGMGPNGYLFITGHDDPALYVLALPLAGSELTWVATVPISTHGQAFAWDPDDPGLLYTINKATREVVVGRLTHHAIDDQ